MRVPDAKVGCEYLGLRYRTDEDRASADDVWAQLECLKEGRTKGEPVSSATCSDCKHNTWPDRRLLTDEHLASSS